MRVHLLISGWLVVELVLGFLAWKAGESYNYWLNQCRQTSGQAFSKPVVTINGKIHHEMISSRNKLVLCIALMVLAVFLGAYLFFKWI